MDGQEVARHFGYEIQDLAPGYARWANDGSIPERLGRLPEVLDFEKKFRVMVDYDPEYPRALIQLFTD